MKHSFYASALALTLGLSGCSTLEGVWADIKTAKPFKSTQSDDNVQEARDVDLAALSDDMHQARAIWNEPEAQIVETGNIQFASISPKPIQLRGRYQFDHGINTHASQSEARQPAKIGPQDASFLGAIQIYDYHHGSVYQIYGAPEQVTDIALEPGEELISVSAGDTVRWMLGDTRSGSGLAAQVHILIKPLEPGIKTNLIILTSKRSYYAELEARPDSYMPAIAWNYDNLNYKNENAYPPVAQTIEGVKYASMALSASEATLNHPDANEPVENAPAFENLDFNYRIKGDRPAWRPVRAFDDGSKVYIQFPVELAQSEAPPLFVLSEDGATSLVNYRVKGRYYVVDRLFERAELRLGEKRQKIVRIIRDDRS